MRLDLGGFVRCSDAAFGRLEDVVVDPTASLDRRHLRHRRDHKG
jgi:hypothetical protein